MHPRVERLPQPRPDYRRFLRVIRRERPDHVPLIELAIHPEVVNALLDASPVAGRADDAWVESVRRNIRLHHRLGYDVVKCSARIPWTVRRLSGRDGSGLTRGDDARAWADEHDGPIGSLEDLREYPWPTCGGPCPPPAARSGGTTRPGVDFRPVEAAIAALPDGMGIVGFCGGVLEFAMDLMGMQRLMLAAVRDPELVAAVIQHVGDTILGVFEAYCRLDAVKALWLGDDLGHKHGLLISPRLLRRHILPWYRRFAELAHAAGRPFLLHTCGQTERIMPDLVEQVGIDAKHSFEDGIEPVEQFYDRWHDRIAVLGGIDVHLLATGTPAAIRARTLAVLEHTADGGYAAGSGNSIPNYVPPENFLSMIEAVAAFNAAR